MLQYRTNLKDEIAGAEDISFDSFTRNELVSAMLSIKDEYREILILRYVDEMEFDDISKLLNISPENARQRLSRARIVMKKKMEAIND